MDEIKLMSPVRHAWAMRCHQLGLRPATKARQREMEAFLQGVIATATSAGVMTMERAAMIAFLVTVGRGEDFLAIKEEVAA